MQDSGNKRATQFRPDQVPLLGRNPPGNEAVIPSPPGLKSEQKHPPGGRLGKRSADTLLTDPGQKIVKGAIRPFALGDRSRPELSAGSDQVIREESPWDTCRKYCEYDLAGTVSVCDQRSRRRGIWAIRQYPRRDADRILEILRNTRHPNVDSARECFLTSDILYTLSEFYPLTLEHVVACQAFPDERELAAIMSQFIDGLSFLITHNLQHTSLDCSSVLLSADGEIRISRIDCCAVRPAGRIQGDDLAPVSRVMMELMQKYVKADGAIGIDDLGRWRNRPAAVEFLSATTSAGSFEELKKQRLLTEIHPSPDDLLVLAWFAGMSARSFYSYVLQRDEDE